ncbi:YtxH-like protein [Peptococcaceae bacterium CEB3]|nr:YtxH-like protein [Peptococcaceae bacterium CEB3]
MEKSPHNKLGAITTAALIGGLAGAAVALLLAPTTGRELRRNLQKRADVLMNEEPEWLEKGKQLVEDLLATLQDRTGASEPRYTTIPVTRTPARNDTSSHPD